jgi:dipeptide/tripeptide permease
MNFGSNLGGLISPVLTPWLAAQLGWGTALALAAALALVGARLRMGITIDTVEAGRHFTRDEMNEGQVLPLCVGDLKFRPVEDAVDRERG